MLHALEAWLRSAATRIHEEAPALTALDQAIGDGDHGINMDRGFTAIVAALDARPAPDPTSADIAASADLLRLAGRTLISTVGGASGPLYGTAFLRAAGALATLPADPAPPASVALVAALEAAVVGVSALGKSTTGEKTMLDALAPAASAARAALDARAGLAGVLAAARDAAAAGAAATEPMLATKGRASYLGERSIGHRDPGATSAALLVDVLAGVAADVAV
jgi:phosphoenolpyruvate---glycerone phosphotransferase subunit DhaL